MNAIAQAPSIPEANIPRYVEKLRRFLTQERVDAAGRVLVARMADGNPFRGLILDEKQPWVEAFDTFDRATMRGTRPLRRHHITKKILLAACTGRLFDRIEPTLTEPVAAAMRARLLDVDGRAHPVLMEWSAAHFYLRRGMRIAWTEPNVPGVEFTVQSDGLRFEVECKRITRNAVEQLGDREALTLGHGVLRVLAKKQIAGDIVLESALTRSPPRQDVEAAVKAVLESLVYLTTFHAQVPGIGSLRGSLRRLGPGSGWAQLGDIQRRVDAKPPDHRSFAIAVPHPHAPHPEAAVLWLKGPRRTPEEFRDHILSTAMEGAGQLPGQVMGVVAVEVESIDDVMVFRDTAAIEQISQAVFAAQPALGALLWQGERVFKPTVDGFSVGRQVLAYRNAACAFDGAELPLVDGA